MTKKHIRGKPHPERRDDLKPIQTGKSFQDAELPMKADPRVIADEASGRHDVGDAAPRGASKERDINNPELRENQPGWRPPIKK